MSLTNDYISLTNRTNVVDRYNSTSTNLTADSSFIGSSIDVSKYSSITICIGADQDSSAGGIQIQFSPDNRTYRNYFTDMYLIGDRYVRNILVRARYFRLIYTNGDTTTSMLMIQVLLSESTRDSSEKSLVMIDINQLDGFGRLKVSTPTRILDLTHTKGKNNDRETEKITGTGTSTYNSNESSVDLDVVTTGDEVIRQSRHYCIYQAARSITGYLTGVLNPNDSNDSTVTTRFGYFDDLNGFYIQYVNGVTSIVLRSNVTGSVVNTVINQSSFNFDKLDGTGPSGFTFNPAKVNILYFTAEWLASGSQQFGLFVKGRLLIFHTFYNSNKNNTSYMTSANLPVRYQINSTGGSGSLKQICSSIQSDAGHEELGIHFSANRGSTVTASIGTTPIPLISMRIRIDNESHARTNVILESFSAMSIGNKDTLYELWINFHENSNPLTSSSFTDVDTLSSVQIDTSATAVTLTNLRLLKSIYSVGSANSELDVDDLVGLSVDINRSVSDMLILTARTISGNNVYVASFNWRENY